jgi:plasmid stabilization system protein ParE
LKIRFAAPASAQAARIDWRRENRPAAGETFVQELEEARRLLETTLELGTPYQARKGRLIRRLLLRRSRNHLYYEIDYALGAVLILAVWGAPTGREPKL